MSWMNSWRKRQKITIDHTKVDENLQNFPVKVILPNDSSIFDYAQADGADIRFTAGDGTTLLDFEREVHNKTEKIAVYHVKMPSISSTSDTDFYIYYDNPIADDASNPNAVWDENYKLVMHMTPDLKDSTSNGNDGTNYGSTLGLASDGYYRSFDGVDDHIDIPHSAELSSDSQTVEIYFSAPSDPLTNVKGLIFKASDTGAYNREFGLEITTIGDVAYKVSHNDGTLFSVSVPLIFDGANHYIAAIKEYGVTNDIGKISSDGSAFITGTMNGHGLRNTTEVTIGRVTSTSNPGRYYKGNFYEARISSTARSDAWVKATSESLHNTLLTLGEIETPNKTRMQVVFIRLLCPTSPTSKPISR